MQNRKTSIIEACDLEIQRKYAGFLFWLFGLRVN
jgi:hypothetical protein